MQTLVSRRPRAPFLFRPAMDEIVRQALAKWPNVPHCHGWLGLDARGDWYMRDDRAQAAGPFAGAASTPQSRGSRLRHDKLIGFIARNYECDAHGQWFFQNGPQRVYVELEATPWVWRIEGDPKIEGGVRSHTGLPTRALGCLVDEAGRVYLHTPLGAGIVHSLDVVLLADRLEAGELVLEEVTSDELPLRFGFVRSPAATQKKSRSDDRP